MLFATKALCEKRNFELKYPIKMKVLNKFSFLLSFLLIASMAFVSCTKEGPAGLAGKDGKDGKDGEDGINGLDGTATCMQCHDNTQSLDARVLQWESSFHATGDAFARNTGDCATCHTSQGFRGKLDGTYDPTATGAKITNPNPPNCYTCHKIHESYTPGDLALTVSGAIAMNNVEGTHEFGTGNICASCHQARPLNPFPTAGGGDYVIPSPYWGLHHGTQANVLKGVGLFNVGTGLANSLHATMVSESCVTCHMADGYGDQSGGHTMWMRNEAGVMNTAGCISCHTNATDLKNSTAALQAEVTALLAELKEKLVATGVINPTTESPVPGTYSQVVAGCFINYKAVSEDKSLGVHNPGFVKKLLENSIEALN